MATPEDDATKHLSPAAAGRAPKISRVSTTELRRRFSHYLQRVERDGEHLIITRYGKDVAALIPIDDYRRLTEGVER